MARSTYIYILQRNTGEVLNASTVKYECAYSWKCIRSQVDKIIRMRDGRGGYHEMTVEELLKGTGIENN